MNHLLKIIVLIFAFSIIVACSKKTGIGIDLVFDVESGRYQEHVFENMTGEGEIQGDFEFIDMHYERSNNWIPTFKIGCEDEAGNAFKIIVVPELINGIPKEGGMYAGVAGIYNNQVVANSENKQILPGKKYHFEYLWSKSNNFRAEVDGAKESIRSLDLENKTCSIVASSVYVKFSNVTFSE